MDQKKDMPNVAENAWAGASAKGDSQSDAMALQAEDNLELSQQISDLLASADAMGHRLQDSKLNTQCCRHRV